MYRNVYCDTHNEQLTSPLLVNTLNLCRVCFQKIMYVEYFLSPVNVLISEENSRIKKENVCTIGSNSVAASFMLVDLEKLLWVQCSI